MLEIMVASALAGGLALVIAQIGKNSGEVSKRADTKSSAQMLTGQISSRLSDPTTCANTLSANLDSLAEVNDANLSGATSGTGISLSNTGGGIYDKGGTGAIFITKTGKYGEITLTDIKLRHFNKSAASAELYITGTYKLSGKAVQMKPITIPIDVTVNGTYWGDPGFTGSNCSAAGKYDNIWMSVSDGSGIFYNGGNVGIGTATPSTALHIVALGGGSGAATISSTGGNALVLSSAGGNALNATSSSSGTGGYFSSATGLGVNIGSGALKITAGGSGVGMYLPNNTAIRTNTAVSTDKIYMDTRTLFRDGASGGSGFVGIAGGLGIGSGSYWDGTVVPAQGDAQIEGSVSIGTQTFTAGTKLKVVGGETELQQEAWTNFTMNAGFAKFWGSFNPSYMKDSMGFVHLRGCVKNVSGAGNPFADLPAGYRSPWTAILNTCTWTVGGSDNLNDIVATCAPVVIAIQNNGPVVIYGGNFGVGKAFCMDGLRFSTF